MIFFVVVSFVGYVIVDDYFYGECFGYWDLGFIFYVLFYMIFLVFLVRFYCCFCFVDKKFEI